MSRKLKKELVDLSFLIPALLLFLFFVLLPFLQGFPMSFTDWDGMSKTNNHVGWSNYAAIFSDKNVGNAVFNTLQFTVLTVIFPNIFGLAIALLIHRKSTFNNVIRTIIFLPYCLSIVLTSFTWKYMFNDVFYGVFGLLNPLGSSRFATVGLSIICIWASVGYCMVIYIAGLQSIPAEYYEAAKVDGASPATIFWKVTLPLIMPSVNLNVTLLLGWGLKAYDYVMTATGGGPGRSSETIALLVYNNMFVYFKAGYGQAFAIVMTLLILAICGWTTRILRAREVSL